MARSLVVVAATGIAASIVFQESEASETVWHVPDGVRDAQDLKRLIARAGHETKTPLEVYGRPDEAWVAWLGEIYPGLAARFGDRPPIQAGARIDIEHAYGVTEEHRRAVAMAAFHPYLNVDDSLRGDEPCFEPIRRYVDGTNPDRLCQLGDEAYPAGLEFQFDDGRPDVIKSVFLFCKVPGDGLAAAVRLFLGPDPTCSPWWFVTLQTHGARNHRAFGVAFVYFPDEPRRINGRLLHGTAVPLRFSPGTVLLPPAPAGEADASQS